MSTSIDELPESSLAFRQVLLKRQRKRIVGVITFLVFFAILVTARIFVFGSAMNRWGVVVTALEIAVEFGILRAVNQVLLTGRDLASLVWCLNPVLVPSGKKVW
jgi:hypothetical protein